MKSNHFDSKQVSASSLYGAWPQTGLTLETMMWLFYHVRNFKVHLTATDTGASYGGDSGTGISTGSIGLSQRRTENAPDLLNQLDAAYKKTLIVPPDPADVTSYQTLQNKAQTTAAQGESKFFLRALDINTSGIYPIFYYSGNNLSVRIDLGSVKKSGNLYYPACYATLGVAGSSINGLDIIGYVTVVGVGGLQIPIYNSAIGNLAFASGEMTPNEIYDDLVFTPGRGPGGTQVQIAMPNDPKISDPSKQKSFSGFHNVTKVTYDGYDITSSFQKTSRTIGNDPLTNKPIINETCTLTIPQGARSSYFSFICEGQDDYKATVYDQYTLPQQFIVTASP